MRMDPQFASRVKPNDIIIAGKNWGCGSSREQAVVCLSEAKLGAIVAKSFARIYYRNCLNNALPAITCTEAVDAIQDGEVIEIDDLVYLVDYMFSSGPAPVVCQ